MKSAEKIFELVEIQKKLKIEKKLWNIFGAIIFESVIFESQENGDRCEYQLVGILTEFTNPGLSWDLCFISSANALTCSSFYRIKLFLNELKAWLVLR